MTMGASGAIVTETPQTASTRSSPILQPYYLPFYLTSTNEVVEVWSGEAREREADEAGLECSHSNVPNKRSGVLLLCGYHVATLPCEFSPPGGFSFLCPL